MHKKKILITGYPFSGTTILKSKFGESNNVYEIIDEGFEIKEHHIGWSGDKEFVLIKTPVMPLEIRVHGVHFLTTNHPESIYKDYSIVFIQRNPWNIFSSTIKAGFNPLSNITNHHQTEYHFTISEYFVSLERFLEARNGKFPNIYTIRYEDLFVDNYKQIKDIMDSIGLDYNSEIFDTKTKDYQFRTDLDINTINEKPDTYELGKVRTWQINQPFRNMNTNDINIPDELDKLLKESPLVREMGYTDPRITN